MNVFLLKAWARCRRLFQGLRRIEQPVRETTRIEHMMRRANPFASWVDRAHWMVDVAAWLRQEPPVWSEQQAGLHCAHHRTRLLLDWLQQHRDVRRVVQTTLQKTLREAIGPDIFCAAGLPRAPAFLAEITKHAFGRLLPGTIAPADLSGLLLALFPEGRDDRWLRSLDHDTSARLWKLMADDAIRHAYQQQIDEALQYLVTMILASGISSQMRQRLSSGGPGLPLRATPFMALRRELEKYLAFPVPDQAGMRSVRMLVAVCQAQTDKVYEHLDEHGVSVALVYEVEKMRAQLTRVARLLDLRSALLDEEAGAAVQNYLAETIRDHHRSTAGSLIGRSFSLLTRKLVERNGDQHARYIARNRQHYSAILRAACAGGAVAGLSVMAMLAIESVALTGFFEGMAYASLFAVALLAISAAGGVLAGRQSPVVAATLAARMGAIDTLQGMRSVLAESAALSRAQTAALAGNLLTTVPVMLIIALAVRNLAGTTLMPVQDAHATLAALSPIGMTPLLAILTGVLLWLAGVVAGLADNWFTLRRMRDVLAHHRGLLALAGTSRAARFAAWCEQHVASITGSIALGFLLGMMPAVSAFFGLPLDIRHSILSAGMLAAASSTIGQQLLFESGFWLAALGVLLTAILNMAVPFLCSLGLAMHTRGITGRARRALLRSLLRRLRAAPRQFLLPVRQSSQLPIRASRATRGPANSVAQAEIASPRSSAAPSGRAARRPSERINPASRRTGTD